MQAQGLGLPQREVTPLRSEAGAGALAAPPARRGLIVEPRITAIVTATDNIDLDETDRRSDVVLELRPGVAVTANGQRVRGALDYSLRGVVSTAEPDRSRVAHALSGHATVTWVDSLLFTDARVRAGLEQVSPFGRPVSGTGVDTADTRQTWGVLLSPYAKGRLGRDGNWLARYSVSYDDAAGSIIEGTLRQGVVLEADTLIAARLRGAVRYQRDEVEPRAREDYTTERARAEAVYRVSDALSALVYAGYDHSRGVVFGDRSGTGPTYGAGITWTSGRTELDARAGRRWFGNDYRVRFRHRAARWAVSLSALRDIHSRVTDFPLPETDDLPGLLDHQLQTRVPDPVERAQVIDQFLRERGLETTLAEPVSLLTDRPFLSDSISASAGLFGGVNAIVGTVGHTRRRLSDTGDALIGLLSTRSTIVDDFASVAWAHRLGGRTIVTATTRFRRSEEQVSRLETRLLEANVQLVRDLGPRTSARLLARHRDQDGRNGGASFRENAVVGAVTHRF